MECRADNQCLCFVSRLLRKYHRGFDLTLAELMIWLGVSPSPTRSGLSTESTIAAALRHSPRDFISFSADSCKRSAENSLPSDAGNGLWNGLRRRDFFSGLDMTRVL